MWKTRQAAVVIGVCMSLFLCLCVSLKILMPVFGRYYILVNISGFYKGSECNMVGENIGGFTVGVSIFSDTTFVEVPFL